MTRVKASTLLEVIVAMVIILIVFVMATGIFTKVIGSSPSVKQQQVRSLVSAVIQESFYTHHWKDESIEIDGIVLQKTVVPYLEYPDLLLISVIATEHGKEIGRSNQVIRKGKDDSQ